MHIEVFPYAEEVFQKIAYFAFDLTHISKFIWREVMAIV